MNQTSLHRLRHVVLISIAVLGASACSGAVSLVGSKDMADAGLVDSGSQDAGSVGSQDASPNASDASTSDGVEVRSLTWANTTMIDSYAVNFQLHNGAATAVESLEFIDLKFDDAPYYMRFTINFAAAGVTSKTCPEWNLAPAASSGAIKLVLSSNGGSIWKLAVPCQGEVAEFTGQGSSPLPTSAVSMRLGGLLVDATPWTASASGKERN